MPSICVLYMWSHMVLWLHTLCIHYVYVVFCSGDEKDNLDEDGERQERPRKPRRTNGPRANRGSTVSVFVGGLPRSTRVSQLKVGVREREVQPLAIIWHGGSGHAFLLFPAAEEAQDALTKLDGLEMNGKQLRIEMANRRSRKSASDSEQKDDGEAEVNPATQAED